MAFVKGKSGNPGGRPKIIEEFRAACQADWPKVHRTWRRIMLDRGADPFARIAAAEKIASYAFGKPAASVAFEDPNGAVSTLADVIRRGLGHEDEDSGQ